MSETEGLRQQLESAESQLYKMLAEVDVAVDLIKGNLKHEAGEKIRRQQIIVAWLRAEYTGQALSNMRGELDEVEVEEFLEERAPRTAGEQSRDSDKLARLRSIHLEAYNLLTGFTDWVQVMQEYRSESTSKQ